MFPVNLIKPSLPLLKAAPLSIMTSSCTAVRPDRPNILIIMLDDMGYSDLGCYGGEIRTPNIDQLANSGIRFTQMHNCARCCPTRASLLTGHYPQVAGIKGMGVNMAMNSATLAEVLRGKGYHTGMTGKWNYGESSIFSIRLAWFIMKHPSKKFRKIFT